MKFFSVLLLIVKVQCELPLETATFESANSAQHYLWHTASLSANFVRKIDLQFRTSQSDAANVFWIENESKESFGVRISSDGQLNFHFKRKSMLNSDNGLQNLSLAYEITLKTVDVRNGVWHHLSVLLDNGGYARIDGQLLDFSVPRNFTIRFAYNRKSYVVIGLGFVGCFSNFTLDNAIRLALHRNSELLDENAFMTRQWNALPNTGPGCRQSQCQCEPNGLCIYKRWNLLDRCNCGRGYDEASLCQKEIDPCKHLDASEQCLNGGKCVNGPGIGAHSCECPPEFTGSRCQVFDFCHEQSVCQNGAICNLIGQLKTMDAFDYECVCTPQFTGTNCTESKVEESSNSAVLIVALSVFCTFLIASWCALAFVIFSILRFQTLRSAQAQQGHEMSSGPIEQI